MNATGRGRKSIALDRRQVLGGSLLGAALLPGCAARLGADGAADSNSINARMRGDISPVHDPCVIKHGETYYLFSTTGDSERDGGGFIPCRVSRDLVSWERAGFVFDAIPEWARAAVPGTRGIWAPDISHFNGCYHLYYSVSTFGSNYSVIGLATNATLDTQAPDFGWRDEGLVLQSRREDEFNAIDPNLIVDRQEQPWLSWGSFWSGLKLTRIDAQTGKRPEPAGETHSIAARPTRPGAVEAPFIVERGGFYYLFASFDFCCRGVRSTYRVVVGRSRDIAGPYADADGRALLQGGGAPVIAANERFKGPGHNAILSEGETDYLVYHAYDATRDGAPTLRISPIAWTADGWPQAQL